MQNKKKYKSGILKYFLLFYFVFATSLSAIDIYLSKIVDIYKKYGLQQTGELIESYFRNKDFWLNYLKDIDTTYGYYESVEYIFVSNKSIPDLKLLKVQNGNFEMLIGSDALVGQGRGAKQKEGDLITPIGVYDIIDKLTKLDQYYGPLALVTSYPNSYDKALGKTGYGIWIHGKPLNGDRHDKTRGCIVVDNDQIVKYEESVRNKNTILITYEDILEDVSKDTIATILSNIYTWKDAWTKGDLESYLSFYSDQFVRPDKMSYLKFIDYKKRVFSKNEDKKIDIKNINISPYPNDQDKDMYIVTFNQNYKAFKNGKMSYSSESKKELYVMMTNDDKIQLKILSEK